MPDQTTPEPADGLATTITDATGAEYTLTLDGDWAVDEYGKNGANILTLNGLPIAKFYAERLPTTMQQTVAAALRTSAREDALTAAARDVLAEVEKATAKFPTWPTRLIDAGNVVSEEAGELAKACLQVTYEPHKETLSGVRMEAIQTAAMCLRFLASMDHYDTTPGPQHSQSETITVERRPLDKADSLNCGNNPHAIEVCDDCERDFRRSLNNPTLADDAGTPDDVKPVAWRYEKKYPGSFGYVEIVSQIDPATETHTSGSNVRNVTPLYALTASGDARERALRAETIKAAANIGYLTCAKTRHVTLGDTVKSEILALLDTPASGGGA